MVRLFRILCWVGILWSVSCTATDTDLPDSLPCQSEAALRYFGFALVDVGWDDPLDAPADKTNYLDEVASFTNLADILLVNPSDDIKDRLDAMQAVGVMSYLHLNEIFFVYEDSLAPSGANYQLRSDYQSRWTQLLMTNNLLARQDQIAAFYLGEEAFWNGITYEELRLAADFIKTTIPAVPIMLIEAYPILDQIQIPTSIDWVGFDHYFLEDPMTDPNFLQELELLKAKRSRADQRLVLVMDTHYISWAHGDWAGLSPEDMEKVANRYYQLALSEPETVALIGYFWPGGFDDAQALGARHVPTSVQANYRRIGKNISKK